MNLAADKYVDIALGIVSKDEAGNTVPTDPADFTTVYEGNDPVRVTVTDNGDGTARAAATGVLGGPAVVTATVTHVPSGRTGIGVLAIEVVAGEAEVFEVTLVPGEPQEITPDA